MSHTTVRSRGVLAAALFVLAPAAAGTRVVSADLRSFTHDWLDYRRSFAAASRGGFFLRLTAADDFVGSADVFADAVAADLLVLRAGDVVGAALLHLADDAGAENEVCDLVADAGHHLLEIAEALFLVDDAGVLFGE